jgi:hypothetical protein
MRHVRREKIGASIFPRAFSRRLAMESTCVRSLVRCNRIRSLPVRQSTAELHAYKRIVTRRMKLAHIVAKTFFSVSLLSGISAFDQTVASDEASRDRILREPLDRLHAWQIAIGSAEKFADRPLTAPVFSPDGQSVAFGQQQENNSIRIVVCALRDHKVLKACQPAERPTALAWSPAGDKIAYKTGSHSVHIVELATARDIALPVNKYFGSDLDRFVWAAGDKLICFEKGTIYTLDLESLSVSTRDVEGNQWDTAKASIFATPRDHPFCVLYRNEGMALSGPVFIAERDGSYSHVLFERLSTGTSVFPSPDLKHILIAENSSLTHQLLASRPAPELTFQMDLDITEGGTGDSSNQREALEKYLRLGVPFWADVCSPSVNPLNGKVIGPDPNRLKGRVRGTQWSQKTATVRVALEYKPITPGDIACNIASEQWGQFGNWAWKFPGIWRVLRSGGSTSASAEDFTRGGGQSSIPSQGTEAQPPEPASTQSSSLARKNIERAQQNIAGYWSGTLFWKDGSINKQELIIQR